MADDSAIRRFREAFTHTRATPLLYELQGRLDCCEAAALALVHVPHCICGHIKFAHGPDDACTALREKLRGGK